jgi:O-antigen/teichoic acid export membrane protein
VTIRRRLLSAMVSNSLGKATAVGIWLVLTPFALRHLGLDGYALWVLTGALTSYGALLDFGVGGAVVKYVAEHTARGDRAAAGAMIASATWLYFALAVVAVGIGAAIAPVVPPLLGVAPALQRTAVWLVFLTSLNVAITIFSTPVFSVLRGLQRYDVVNAIRIAGSWVEAAAVVAALLAGWGVLGMMAVLVPVNCAIGAAAVLCLRRIAPELGMRWHGTDVATIRQIASFSASLFAIDVAGRLQNRANEFIIAFFGAIAAVTPYALARKLGEIAQMIALQSLQVVMPIASALDTRDDTPRLRMLYIVSSRIVLGIAVPITIALLLFGRNILTLWVGPEYAAYAPVLGVLAVASLVSTSQWPALQILQGVARHRLVAYVSLAAGVANVVLSVTLLPHFGLLGVAFGTLIPATAAWLGIVMPFANRTLKVSWGEALREIWMPGLLPGVAAVAVVTALNPRPVEPSLIPTAGWVALASVLYATGYLLMPAAGAERRLFGELTTDTLGRLGRKPPALSRP